MPVRVGSFAGLPLSSALALIQKFNIFKIESKTQLPHLQRANSAETKIPINNMPHLLQSLFLLIAVYLLKKWLSDRTPPVKDSVEETAYIAHPAPPTRIKRIKYYVNQKQILSTHEIYYRRILSIPITFDFLQHQFIEDYHRKRIEACEDTQAADLDAARCYMNDLIKYFHSKN